MSIWGLIGHSYALPLQKFGSLVKVFWLPVLVWVIFAIGSEYAHRHLIEPGTFTFFALPVVFLLCFTIAIASGLVRWHRHLIKDNPPESAQPWLQRGEWQFLWRWSWLGLMFGLLAVLGLLVGGCILSVTLWRSSCSQRCSHSFIVSMLCLTGMLVRPPLRRSKVRQRAGLREHV